MNNLDRLIDKFVQNGAPYFLIVDGRQGCPGKNAKHNDIQQAATRLRGFLEDLDQESKSVYKVYCFDNLPVGKLNDDAAKIVKKGDHDYLLSFCAYTPKEISGDVTEARVMYRLKMEQEREQMRQELAQIKELLQRQAVEENEETDEDIEQQVTPTNVLGALLNNPQMQQVLAAGLAGMVSRFFTPAGTPQAVAGIPGLDTDDERLNQAIATLKHYDNDLVTHLEKLADMAENNTAQFTMLIKML